VRLFVAINLPNVLQSQVYDATEALREAAPWVAWTPAAKLHLTVKFIGERDDGTVPALAEELARATAPHAPIDVSMGGIGAFPNFRRPHVVWMGVQPHPRLELLHHDVEQACERQGIDVEGRAFRPHLTLGRIGSRPDPDALRSLARARRHVTFRTEILVESVDLMRSELLPGGARHTLVAAAPLLSA
jgi:RNA 2',3'-cyclic 3'-phosphodiesterase